MKTALLIAILLALNSQVEAQLVRGRDGRWYQPAPPAPVAPAVPKLDEKKDGHIGYNAGDMADMPADKLYMTLVMSDDWATDTGPRGVAQRKLKAWMENDKRLIAYRQASNFNFYTASNPLYTGARTLANGQASSLRARLGEAYPILDISKSDGESKFKMSAMSLPGTAGELGDWITSSIKANSPALPAFEGQSLATPIVTENPEQCPPDVCPTPNYPTPPSDTSEVIDDTPRPVLGGDNLALVVLGGSLLAAGGLTAAGIARPGVKK